MRNNKGNINVNCDLGEGLENDPLIMPLVQSCSIACGGHAGDESTMSTTVKLALHHGVQIGAHPSFPDRENFGRLLMDLDPQVLKNSLIEQLKSLENICQSEGAQLVHVKPHGAIYNECVRNAELSNIVLDSIGEVNDQLVVFCPFGSVIYELAITREMNVCPEAFADRNYNDDLSLVSRKDPKALVGPNLVVDHVKNMVDQGYVKTISGKSMNIKAQTFCVHGDNPHAVDILTALNAAF